MLEYWYMFPVGTVIATIAMAFGIGGAALFTPFFTILLGLPAAVAVGAGLFIEIFGFGSGVVGFARKKLIDYRLARSLLVFTVPAAVVGALLAQRVPEYIILGGLALLLLVLGVRLFGEHEVLHKDHRQHADTKTPPLEQVRPDLKQYGVLGGLLAGMVSTGLGEINDYVFLRICKLRGAVAAGTSVFVVAITAVVGSVAHGYAFFSNHAELFPMVLGLLLFAVPGVVIGAQIGVAVSDHIPEDKRQRMVSILFFVIATITVFSIFR